MRQGRKLVLALAMVAALFANTAGADSNLIRLPAPDEVSPQSFDKWKAELVDDLKQNWLSLAGLFWLKPGEVTFGTDAGNAIVFPKGPAHAGVFQLQGTEVTVKFSSEA